MQNKRKQAMANRGWKRNKIKEDLKNKPAKRKKKSKKEIKCHCKRKRKEKNLHKYLRKLAKGPKKTVC